MKHRAIWLAAFVLLLTCPDSSPAHRVNVFAMVDGDAVRVECSFSRSQKVRNGRLTIQDLETGAVLLEGTTDGQGLFRFRPPEDFLETGHGLNILLNAGEGHRNDWQVSAEELRALAPSGRAGVHTSPPAAEERARSAVSATPVATVAMSAEELEALIGRVVDAKLAPVREALARQRDSGPGLRDIIGGLGWILGLLGLAVYMKYRR